MEVAGQGGNHIQRPRHIRLLCLELLHAHTIRGTVCHPRFKAFPAGGANAIEVEAGQFEQGLSHGFDTTNNTRH